MAKSVASPDRSKTPQASSNVKSTSRAWPSFEIRRFGKEAETDIEYWYPPCCAGRVPYPLQAIEFHQLVEYPGRGYRTLWMCEDCARKHGLIW